MPRPEPTPRKVESPSGNRGVMAVVLMSLFAYPGTGHFVLKEYSRGTFWVVLYTLTLLGALLALLLTVYRFYSGFTMGDFDEGVSSSLVPMVAMVGFGAAWFMTAILSAVDAARLSRRNEPESGSV